MSEEPQHLISPNFSFEKLNSPNYPDLIDVFEDRMRGWFLAPIGRLLEIKDGDVAAAALLLNYFEGIEIFIAGEDSKGKSPKFFANGFLRVCSLHGAGFSESTKAALVSSIYEQARCGFAHDGMSRNKVFFSRHRPQAILVTWPKTNGLFIESGKAQSIIINPARLYELVVFHLTEYLKKLRSESDAAMKEAFLRAVKLKWGLEEEDPLVGMTESEFWSP